MSSTVNSVATVSLEKAPSSFVIDSLKKHQFATHAAGWINASNRKHLAHGLSLLLPAKSWLRTF